MKRTIAVVVMAVGILAASYVLLGVYITTHQKQISIIQLGAPTQVGSRMFVSCRDFEGISLSQPYDFSTQEGGVVSSIHAEVHWTWKRWRPARIVQVCEANEFREGR